MYFRLLPDMTHDQRILSWPELLDGTPLPLTPSASFVNGIRWDGAQPVHLAIAEDGQGPEVDFSFGFGGMPVVRRALASGIMRAAPDEIQLVDVVIGESDTDFVILNALKLVDCIDESRSITTPLSDAQRAYGRTGKYSMVARVHLLSDSVGDAQFFRLTEWPMALMASEQVVNVLQEFEATGVRWEAA